MGHTRAATAIALVLYVTAGMNSHPEEHPAVPPKPERVEVNLVLIDVVVRDRKDQPVPGLELDDFELSVDGRVVPSDQLVSLEELCPAASPPAPTAQAAAAIPDQTLSPAPSAPAAHIVLYFDFTQISFPGRQLSLTTARKFVLGRVGPWPPVMIVDFTGGVPLVVQPFTTDPQLLAKRLDELIADRGTVDHDVVDELDKFYQVAETPMPIRIDVARGFAEEELQRARRSLAALREGLTLLEGLRGRKAVVLFTDSLRIEPGVQYLAQADMTPLLEGIHINNEVIALTRTANEMGVSFYDVHAGGLQDGTGDVMGPLVAFMRTGIDSAIGLQVSLAIETGGYALHNNNDPGRIIGSAERDLSCYYILGYRNEAPESGARHKIVVKVRPRGKEKPRRGLVVRHRPYFIDKPQRPPTS